MKTYTIEELEAAQNKGCRIEYKDPFGNWVECSDREDRLHIYACLRIHPADEWKARLPRLKEGAEWHRNDFTNEMLEGGFRPLLDREVIESGDEFLAMLDTDPEWTSYPLSDDTDDGSNASIGHPCDSVFFPHRTRRPVPPEFLHPDELAKQPETRVKELEEERKDISSCRDAACAKLQRHYDTLRNLAVATWRTNYADEAPQWEPLPDIDGIIGQIDNMTAGLAQQVAELKWENAKILSALHLRPIAEAGPVPEGAVRLWASYIEEMQDWSVYSAFTDPSEFDTHFIDIYPPQQ